MYSALTFNQIRTSEDLGGSGDIYLPWVDIIPEWGWLQALHINNLPVRITLGESPLNASVAVFVGLAMSALIGIMAHLLVFRPLRHASPLSKVLGSVGVMIYLQAVAFVHFGRSVRGDQGLGVFSRNQEPVRNFLGLGSDLPTSNLWLFVAGVVVTVGAWALIRFTRFGLAARAVDENERGISLLGYSADAIAGTTWVISAILAGIVGMMFVGFTQPSNMTLLVVPALGAALVGNLTSVAGAALGGVAIGMIQSGGIWVAGREGWPDWAPADGVRQVIPLVIVIAILFLRGDKLPVRGSLVLRGQARAPASPDSARSLLVVTGFTVFLVLVGNWRIDSGITTTLVAGIFMLSLVVLIGFLGQVSLAQWSLAGLAAFLMIRLSADGTSVRATDLVANTGADLPAPLAALLAVVIVVLVGVVIGLPALQVRGFQLAIITITAVIAIEDLFLGNPVLMGEGAISSNPTPVPRWFGIYVGGPRQVEQSGVYAGTPDSPGYTALVIIMSIICALLVANTRRGVIGRRFLAVRSNERAAAAVGIDVGNTKLLGFAISSGLAAVAGVLFAYKIPAVTASNFGLFAGLGLLAFAYIAGITTVKGAFLGGVLVSGGLLASLSGSDSGGSFTRYAPLVGAFGLLAAARMANGEGILRLSDRRQRWKEHWNDRPAEKAAWGDAGRIPVLVLGGIAMADFIARGILPIALEDLQDEFGFSDTQAGFLPFADVMAGAAVVVFAGRLADRVNRTRLLTVLMVVWAATSALTGAIQRFAHLFVLRTALGMMTTIDDPTSSSLLSDFYPARLRHKAFSWRLVAPILGGAFGTLAAGIVIDKAGWRWAFVVGAIPAALLIWFVSQLPEPARGASDGHGAAQGDTGGTGDQHDNAAEEAVPWGESLSSIWRVKSIPYLIAGTALSFGPPIGVTFWAPTFLRRHHDLTAGEAAGLFGFASLAGALIGAWVASRGPELVARRMPAGGGVRGLIQLLPGRSPIDNLDPTVEHPEPEPIDPDRLRHIKLWIAVIGAELGILLLMLAYSPTPVSLKFPFLVFGAAGLVAAGPILVSLISEVTPARIRGSVFSVNAFFRLLLSALTPLAIGFIADQITFTDRDVPVAIVDDQAVEDRADRYECIDGRVKLGDLADDDDRPGIANYECGDDEVGHLGAGMVIVLSVGALSGFASLQARRTLDDDVAALGATEVEALLV